MLLDYDNVSCRVVGLIAGDPHALNMDLVLHHKFGLDFLLKIRNSCLSVTSSNQCILNVEDEEYIHTCNQIVSRSRGNDPPHSWCAVVI